MVNLDLPILLKTWGEDLRWVDSKCQIFDIFAEAHCEEKKKKKTETKQNKIKPQTKHKKHNFR